jgi:hypothetical protein
MSESALSALQCRKKSQFKGLEMILVMSYVDWIPVDMLMLDRTEKLSAL